MSKRTSLTVDEQLEAVDRADWRSQYRDRVYPGQTGTVPDYAWLSALHAEGFEIVRRVESSDPAPERHGEDVDDYSMCICGRPMDGHPESSDSA